MNKLMRFLSAASVLGAVMVFKALPVYAIQPSTQSELDKANANMLQVETEMRQAYDNLDKLKAALDQAYATGDKNAIYEADLAYKNAENLINWYIGQYGYASAYLDQVKRNRSEEKVKEDYTNYVLKKAEVDLAAGAYEQAMVQLKNTKDILTQTQLTVDNLTKLVPTHPELQAELNVTSMKIPVLQASIANLEVNVNTTKAAWEAKKDEWDALKDVVWTYGEHKIVSSYTEPFYPVEKIW